MSANAFATPEERRRPAYRGNDVAQEHPSGRPHPSRCAFGLAIKHTGVFQVLQSFDPHVAGTPPLGLIVPTSDIDILCHAPDADLFAEALWRGFNSWPEFAIHQWSAGSRAVIARFRAFGWRFEIFGDPRPVRQQEAWRHFHIEKRLLRLGGAKLRSAVMSRRRQGLKTEPAFVAALGLEGDPYEAMLVLHQQDDLALLEQLVLARIRIST
jgi:hypothetical protein